MYTLFIILIVLALYHFVMESTVLPSMRIANRYRLFALRDELRSLFIEQKDKFSENDFGYMESKVNITIQVLNELSFSVMSKANRIIQEKRMHLQKIEEREKLLSKHEIGELVIINEKIKAVIIETFFVNSLGWLPYILIISPLILIVAFVIYFMQGFKKYKNKITQIQFLTNNDVDNLHLDGGKTAIC